MWGYACCSALDFSIRGIGLRRLRHNLLEQNGRGACHAVLVVAEEVDLVVHTPRREAGRQGEDRVVRLASWADLRGTAVAGG